MSAVSGQRSVVFRGLIFLFSFLILTRFNIDPDFGWHLAIGSKFLETSEIMYGDQFSWTMPGYVFGNYFFLYQILTAVIFNNFGHIFTSLVFGLLSSVAVLILLPKKMNFWQMCATFLGIALVIFVLGVRPSTISFLMFSTTLVFLSKNLTRNLKHATIWFFVFLIWANFHQGFLLGLVFFGVFLGIDLIERLVNKKTFNWTSLVSFFAAIAGTFFTPFNFHIYKSIFLDLSGFRTWSSIAEWKAAALYFPSNIIFALTGVVFIYILVKNYKKLDARLAVIAAFAFMLAFIVVNALVFWVACYIFVVCRYLDFGFSKIKKPGIYLPVTISVILIFVVFFLNFFANLLESVDFRSRLIMDRYPVGAVEYMKKEKIGKNLFNEYAWGGILDWQMLGVKVFIDGRMTGWRADDGTYILSDYLEVVRGNCSVFQKYDIQTALVKSGNNYKCFNKFSVVYEDNLAKVLVKEN